MAVTIPIAANCATTMEGQRREALSLDPLMKWANGGCRNEESAL